MTVPVSAPSFTRITAPSLPLTQLSDDERGTITRLQSKIHRDLPLMELNELYYLGEQAMQNLGIAIPPELQGLRTVIGWPATAAVDPLQQRCNLLGFRRRHGTEVDPDLMDLWDANHLAAEQSPFTLDFLTLGSGWFTLGGGGKDELPLIRVESPMNMAAEWDPRTLRPKNVLQQYYAEQAWHAALYTASETLFMDADENNQWVVVDRQPHNLGRPLVVRAANRVATRRRDGSSEITPAIKAITDAACRALLNLQVAGEIYAVPMRYVLGATESDFQDAAGNMKTAWQTYITRVLALERDENGEVPQVGQFAAYDPSAFTKVLDFYAAQMAGHTGATPQDLGLYTEGNPPSADSVSFMDGRRNRVARQKHASLGIGYVEAMQLGMQLQNNGVLPEDMRLLEVEWEDLQFSSFAASATAVAQLTAGENPVLPPTSDVTLAKLGLTPVERARVEQDRQQFQAAQTLQQIAAQYAPVNSDRTASSPA